MRLIFTKTGLRLCVAAQLTGIWMAILMGNLLVTGAMVTLMLCFWGVASLPIDE